MEESAEYKVAEKTWKPELVEKYPKILRDYGGDPMKTCMAWGFECGPGWKDLLDKAFSRLQYIADKTGVQTVADQVKEKFGGLRLYYHTENVNDERAEDLIEVIVDRAEVESERTCEETGKRGHLCVRGGWLKTLCEEKAEEFGYKKHP